MQELFDRKFISAIKSLNVEDAPLARRMIKGRLDKYMPESIEERDASNACKAIPKCSRNRNY